MGLAAVAAYDVDRDDVLEVVERKTTKKVNAPSASLIRKMKESNEKRNAAAVLDMAVAGPLVKTRIRSNCIRT